MAVWIGIKSLCKFKCTELFFPAISTDNTLSEATTRRSCLLAACAGELGVATTMAINSPK